MILVLILFYAVISVCFFLFWADRSKFPRYYSSLLSISYLRFLEQYILVYVFKLWEYEHLPTPLAKIIGVPILLDVTLFPMLGYLFIHCTSKKGENTIIYQLVWAMVLTGVEATMVGSGMLRHLQYWNFGCSYVLALATIIIIHLQYQLFLRTGWYQSDP